MNNNRFTLTSAHTPIPSCLLFHNCEIIAFAKDIVVMMQKTSIITAMWSNQGDQKQARDLIKN